MSLEIDFPFQLFHEGIVWPHFYGGNFCFQSKWKNSCFQKKYLLNCYNKRNFIRTDVYENGVQFWVAFLLVLMRGLSSLVQG